MDAKRLGEKDGALSAALDELYSAPFDRFMSLRKELAARLRAAGDAAAAKDIAAVNKPTRTAWALNQVARRHPERVTAVIESRRSATRTQTSGDADQIRDGVREHRDAVAELVRAARAVLADDGVTLSTLQARRIGETLQALATDESEREKLIAGRLTRDAEMDDPFAGFEGNPVESSPKRHPPPREEKKEKKEGADDRAAEEAERKREAERLRQEKQRAVEDARARVEELQDALSEARTATTGAERAAIEARAQADRMKEALAAVEDDLRLARDHLGKVLK